MKKTAMWVLLAVVMLLVLAGCAKRATRQTGPIATSQAGNTSKAAPSRPGAFPSPKAGSGAGSIGLTDPTGAGIPGLTAPSLLAGKTAVPADPMVKDVLDRMAAVYKSAKTLRMEGTVHASLTMGREKQHTQGPLSVTFARPNKMKLIQGSGDTEVMFVSNGKTMYGYSGKTNAYQKGSAPKRLTDDPSMGRGTVSTPLLLDGRNIYPVMKNPKLLPSEKIGGVDTYVVQYTPNVPMMPGATTVEKIWIGKNDLLIRQIMTSRTISAAAMRQVAKSSGVGQPKNMPKDALVITQKTVVASINIDEPVPASAFKFSPPKGATLFSPTKMQTPPGMAAPQPGPKGSQPPALPEQKNMTGEKAPSFSMPSLDGKQVSLSDYSGKPVLVLFWSAQSPMSMKALPSVQKASQDLKSRGISVVGVNMDANREAVEKAVKEAGVTFPVLLDYKKAQQTATAYSGGRMGLPTTFVVGKDGKVVGSVAGARTASDFEAELDKLGVK
jgi:peroxiredoxin/outer membrane lipoprotein-sorting protein